MFFFIYQFYLRGSIYFFLGLVGLGLHTISCLSPRQVHSHKDTPYSAALSAVTLPSGEEGVDVLYFFVLAAPAEREPDWHPNVR
ncbi:hypothetical protein F4778DRAFT_722130 [Xylariomycetidae sp. FL2044]|nr:hypothetical protein F4778DRAFT_722130 [Xylariomycetidae sp. FL2044]